MKSKRITALVLSLMLALSMSVTAFADNSKTATVPVTLTVSNQYRAINVTVPAALPVEVRNGAVVTADNISIINNSGTAVQVTGVTVNDGAYKVGSYDSHGQRKAGNQRYRFPPDRGGRQPGALVLREGFCRCAQ